MHRNRFRVRTGRMLKVVGVILPSILLGSFLPSERLCQASSEAGLVAYWNFDEGDGEELQDQSGNGNHGTIYGATWTTGIQGSALSFDGTNDYVSVPESSSLNIGGVDKSFSILAWAKRAAPGLGPSGPPGHVQTIFFQGAITKNMGCHIGWKKDDTFAFAFYQNDLSTSTSYPDVGEWHFWAMTYDGITNSRKIYRDAVLVANDTASEDYLGSGVTTLGKYYTHFLQGTIDEERVYKRALSREEVEKHFGGPLEAPTITVVSPNGGEYWQETQTLTWTVTDPQNDPLTYIVSYSPNGGQTWTQLATGLTDSSYQWDTTTVVDGVNYLIKVEASDGEYTGMDVSDTMFEIANAPPVTTMTTNTTTSPPVTTSTTVQPIIPVTTYPVNAQTETVPYGGFLRLVFLIDPKENWWVKWSFSGSNPEVGIKAMVMEFGESFKFAQGMSYDAYTLSEGKTHDSGTFTIPYTAQWAFIFVNLDSSQKSTTLTVTLQLIETAIKPPNSAPTVRILRPNGGERVRGIYTLMWEATDPDGDVLTFTVSYSPNGGQTWTQLARDITGTSFQWNTARAQEGPNYLIKIEASDGLLTTEDRSDAPFHVEHETAPATSSDTGGGAFITSFGLLEVIGAIIILVGLGRRFKPRAR